ncbi:MAG TPA: SH3 domain-containing protein [Terriglobales bacterium]|nr:SH3 domain-containing protein [Terriglobales bacterium]
MFRYCTAILLFIFLCAALAAADIVRGTTIRVAPMYVDPDTSSAKLADVDRGREVVFLESSGSDWVKVEAALTEERVVTGWMRNEGLIRATTPDGDKILFGEAVDSEDQATRRNGRRDAAQDAMRLYAEVAEIFPQSPLAGEGMYRSADIRWQIEKADVMSLPSAKEQEPYMRQGMNEEYFKKVMKKFPNTKWAYLAAFHLIDNKLCGDWQGQSKCPQKEAEIYENYAKQYPQSPAAAEALYNAAYRWSALIEIYKTEDNAKKSDEAKAKAIEFAQRTIAQAAQSDWADRAQRLLYMAQQGIPAYGNGD